MLRKRLFAFVYNLFGHPNEDQPFTHDVRIPMVQEAHGSVLEIGAGTGGNLPFYREGVTLTLLEPNPFMHPYLEKRMQQVGRWAKIIEAPGEDIPTKDNSFDTVIITHVLCSVGDQTRVLSEVQRVLKPGGVFLFIEHVAAEEGTPKRRMQHLINPAWRFIGDGCHLTRDTGAAVRAAGFSRVELEDFEPFSGVAGPHIRGRAWV